LKADNSVAELAQLNWGRINTVQVRHPFSRAQPWLSRWLDMPESDSAGCSGHCVRVLSGDKGASERFVISPGHPDDAIFHMPGGQSGHFLSTHYRDQHPAWVEGRSLPFFAGTSRHSLVLMPTPNPP
jgi:penicillin amidase